MNREVGKLALKKLGLSVLGSKENGRIGRRGLRLVSLKAPEDENVEMDVDEDLPWPNVELIHKWWNNHKQDFQYGTRCLCGSPMSIGSLNRVLRTCFKRQRIAAAMELAIHQPGNPLFETRVPGFR